VTEFIPISSTGHLILSGHFLDFEKAVGAKAAGCFDVVIQFGSILAVLVLYAKDFFRLTQFKDNKGFSGWRGWWILLLVSLPAGIVGLLFRKTIKEKLWTPECVAGALLVGGLWILVVEYLHRRKAARLVAANPALASTEDPAARVSSIDEIGWKEALFVGCFQCLALWPGMSRSASTILGGMILGLGRKTAAVFSFYAAVPLMVAASAKELYEARHDLSMADLDWFATGFVVSFVVALIAIKTFIRLLSHWTLSPFAWYRILVGAALLVMAMKGMIDLSTK